MNTKSRASEKKQFYQFFTNTKMAALGWDTGSIYSTSVLPPDPVLLAQATLQDKFLAFVENFRLDNDYIYR
jgi:hypothetical protein